jgi:hypothetical protein
VTVAIQPLVVSTAATWLGSFGVRSAGLRPQLSGVTVGSGENKIRRVSIDVPC